MFGRMMNNYYYGKSGKGDFRKEDLPTTRWQLFTDTLRTRLAGLCRLNLLYVLVFLPTIVVIALGVFNLLTNLNVVLAAQDGNLQEVLNQQAEQAGGTAVTITEEDQRRIAEMNPADMINSSLFTMLLWLIPCLAITGPFTTGVCYVTRNWARDEHAFMWSDFKDAVKANWKQGLVLSVITSVLPILLYLGWRYYGSLAATQPLMTVPQVMVAMVAVVWAISVTYMYPLVVSYELKMKDVIRNGLLLGVARLPMSVGIRLLHCVPVVIGVLVAYLWSPMIGMLLIGGWYILIGLSLSRFVTASYTNAVFDRFINPKIEGAPINRGLRNPEDDDDGDETEDEPEEEGEENPGTGGEA